MVQQPRERDLGGGGVVACRHLGDRRVGRQLRGTARERGPQREERHEGELALLAQIELVLFCPVDNAEGVLHTRDVHELKRSADGVGGGVGDPDEVELALAPQILQRAQLLGQATVGLVLVEQAQVDQIHPLTSQRAQVVLDARAELGRQQSRVPSPDIVAAAPDLGHELEGLRIRVQRLADQLVDDVRTVVLRGVDVVDPELDGAAEDRAGTFGIARRSEHAGACELHRAEADAVDGLVAQKRCCVHDAQIAPFAPPQQEVW